MLKEIETARAERVQAQTFLANAMAQQQQAQQAPPPTPSGIKGQDVVGTDWDASSDKAPPAVEPADAPTNKRKNESMVNPGVHPV